MAATLQINGTLVAFPARASTRPLDGFWVRGKVPSSTLLLLVHGMGGNFYRSAMRKEIMQQAPHTGIDVLSFNNRGYDAWVSDEIFTDCRHDLDAALAFGRAQGYRRFVLLGHSTGCQKIAYYQHLRKAPDIAALVYTAIGDDYAIIRQTLGKRFAYWRATARAWVERGAPQTLLRGEGCMGFSARRFLSIAEPENMEARLFNMDGPLREFARITTPTLIVLPEEEEYACIPVHEMGHRLQSRTRAHPFALKFIPKANHFFHGQETLTTRIILTQLNQWLPVQPQPH